MARRINIPLTFGRADRVDPKLAPLGTMAVARNLRVRKDGRLGSRHGYQPLAMGDIFGTTMVAYDLHEFSNGRLVAAGASNDEGFPVDFYEYRGAPAASPWRPSDESGTYRPTLTPFSQPRQVCGVPQPSGGMRAADCAAGGGYVCTVYQPATGGASSQAHIQIVRESDNQVITARPVTTQGWTKIRVCWAVDRFMFFAFDATNTDLELGSFTPGVSQTVVALATVDSAGVAGHTLEIEAVANGSNSDVVLVYGDGTSASTNVLVKRYNRFGAQQGSTLTLGAQVRPLNLCIEADEVDNTVNLLVSSHDGSGVITGVALRTYNFANALLDGPTACNAGYRATLCRLPARTGFAEHVAVASSAISATGNLVVQWLDQDTHAVTATQTISNAMLATAMVPASAEFQTRGVVLGGFVSAEFDIDTNALWYVSDTMIHMVTRDLRNSARNAADFYAPLGLSLDTSTGRLAWQSLYFSAGGDGSDIENFSITTLALNSTARRQSCSAGGSLYVAGAPVQLYDGHSLSEVGFNEVPGIKSITQSTSGSLVPLASYEYVMVWEYTYPDGRFYESPPSPPVLVTLTGANDETVITVFGPHSARVALGDVTYGAEVTGVLYRSVWDAANGSRSSYHNEVARFTCPSAIGSYGDDIVVNDGLSDADADVRAQLYTEGGPVEHNAPEMCSFLSASSGRITVGGLARASEFQESKEQELDECVNFSGLSTFLGSAPNPLSGVLSLDGIRMLFSRTDLFTVTGDGPQNDASGGLPQPVRLPSPGGLRDWRSLLEGPDGVWFQLDAAKLYRAPRGNGAPEWLGVDVQDTLASFPVMTGACRCRVDDVLLFACQDTEAGTDARIIVRSLRTGIWSEDTPPTETSQGIEALCAFGDGAAYVSGGVVYALHETSFADTSSTPIVTQWKTHPIYPFEIGGNGQILDVQATGEFRSEGELALRVSYDDGLTYTTYDSFTLSGAIGVGSTIKRRWALQQSDTQSAVFELTFTPSVAGEGLIINQLTLLVEPSSGLEDLDPADMA
jgi:hypothetical protein